MASEGFVREFIGNIDLKRVYRLVVIHLRYSTKLDVTFLKSGTFLSFLSVSKCFYLMYDRKPYESMTST